MNATFEALLEAVRADDAARVRTLLDGAPGLLIESDDDGKTALHWAAESNASAAAEVLLESGASPDVEADWGATPLDWAATLGSTEVAELLLRGRTDPLDLITAASLGKLGQVEQCLRDERHARRRAAPRVADGFWPETSAHIQGNVVSDALYSAARNGHLEVVECLLHAGASPDAVGVFGATALQWAALGGHEAVVELLVEQGARIGGRDPRFGADAAGWAAEGGHHELAEWLRQRLGE